MTRQQLLLGDWSAREVGGMFRREWMRVVEELPVQCKDGYIIKVANSSSSSDDDYYLRFEGNDGLDGAGAWVECAAPGIVKSLDPATMPHVLQRQEDGDFLVKKPKNGEKNALKHL